MRTLPCYHSHNYNYKLLGRRVGKECVYKYGLEIMSVQPASYNMDAERDYNDKSTIYNVM